MNVLFTTHALPKFLPKTILDQNEVVAGPHYNNNRSSSGWSSMNTPSGEFDIGEVLKKLGEKQRPDYIFAHVDATAGCLPQNLPSFATKVLLVGDTHHLQNPIQKLILYAATVGFDAIIVWNRQHAHFFKEYGFSNVFWIPGLAFAIPQLHGKYQKKYPSCLYGQLGPYHPRRIEHAKALKEKGIPVVGGNLPRMESLELIAESRISLNVTLNSEWNLRVFETTQFDTLLITDKLSNKAGLDLFYPNGDAMMTYESIEDLIKKLTYLIQNENLSATIAAKGTEITKEYFNYEARRKAIFALLNGEETLSVYRLESEPRCLLAPAKGPNEQSMFATRLQIYEWIQEKHRLNESVEIGITSKTNQLIASDLGDLVRVKQYIIASNADFQSSWAINLKQLDIENVTHVSGKEPHLSLNIFITSIADLSDPAAQTLMKTGNVEHIIISDSYLITDDRLVTAMQMMGYSSESKTLKGLYKKI